MWTIRRGGANSDAHFVRVLPHHNAQEANSVSVGLGVLILIGFTFTKEEDTSCPHGPPVYFPASH